MKKHKIIITIVIATMLLVTLMVGCKPKMTVENIYSLASYNTQSGEKGKEIVMEVKLGETVVYKYDKGTITSYPGIDLGNLSFGDAVKGLDFKAAYFEEESLLVTNGVAEYKSKIKDAKNFLGVEATDAKVSISAKVKPQQLLTTDITYNVSSGGNNFSVTISVKNTY